MRERLSTRSRLALAAASLWLLAIVAASYASNEDYWWYVWNARDAAIALVELWARPLATIGAGLALGIASVLLGLASRTIRSVAERDPGLGVATAFLVGASAIGLATYLAAGLVGLSRPLSAGLLAVPAAGGLLAGRGQTVRVVARALGQPWEGGWFGVLGVALLYAATLGALAPDRGVDSLAQHLPFSWWMAEGGRPWTPNPYLVAYYPNLIHSLQAVTFGVAGPSGASSVNPLFLYAAVPLVGRLASRLAPGDAGPKAAKLLFLATVPLGIYTTKASLDVPLTAFVAAAVLYALAWTLEDRPHQAVLALVAGSFAVASKPHGVPIFGLLVFGMLAARRTGWKWIAAGLAAGLPWILPWSIRNAVLVANPFHPFISSTPLQQVGQSPSAIDFLKLPYRLSFEERSFMLPASGGIHLALLPFWFHAARTRRGLVVLGLTAVFGALWYATWPNPRYLLPVLAVLSAFSGVALAWFLERSAPTRIAGVATLAIVTGVAAAVLVGGNYRWDHRGLRDSLAVTLGVETPESYLARHFPPYPAIRYVNRELPEDAVVLLEYGVGPYLYIERPFVIVQYWEHLEAEVAPEDFDAFLAERRVTHVFRVEGDAFDPYVPEWRTRRYGRELFREATFVIQEVDPVSR